jgi:tousled-like kinase
MVAPPPPPTASKAGNGGAPVVGSTIKKQPSSSAEKQRSPTTATTSLVKIRKTTPTTTHTTASKILDFYSSHKKKPRATTTTPSSLTAIAMSKSAITTTASTAALSMTSSSSIDWQAKYEATMLELSEAKSQLRAIHNNRSIVQLSLESALKESRRELQTVRDNYETRLSQYKEQLVLYWQEKAQHEWQALQTTVATMPTDTARRYQQLENERIALQERRQQLLQPPPIDFLATTTTIADPKRPLLLQQLQHAERHNTHEWQLRKLVIAEHEWQQSYELYQQHVILQNRQRKLCHATTQSSRFTIAQVLHQRYVLTKVIGKGGFSEVWQAYDVEQCDIVAVKIHQLDRRWSDTKKANYTKHVSREYDIHRSVQHHRIVQLLNVFAIDADSFATVLEYSNGTDLDAILKECTRLPEVDAKSILLQVLTAMAYLSSGRDHDDEKGTKRPAIIHYDLKPANILLDETRTNVKITDFGLSKIMATDALDGSGGADDHDGLMELTSQGAGTYWYLPPECFLPGHQARISNKVDVWSIGVIYYQMVVGQRPFGHGQTQDAILADGTILNARAVHFPDDVPLSIEGQNFIRTCLMYDQIVRPTMAELCTHPYVIGEMAAPPL